MIKHGNLAIDLRGLFRLALTITYSSDVSHLAFAYILVSLLQQPDGFHYQPVALFIGLRYMRGRAADRSVVSSPGFLPSALPSG